MHFYFSMSFLEVSFSSIHFLTAFPDLNLRRDIRCNKAQKHMLVSEFLVGLSGYSIRVPALLHCDRGSYPYSICVFSASSLTSSPSLTPHASNAASFAARIVPGSRLPIIASGQVMAIHCFQGFFTGVPPMLVNWSLSAKPGSVYSVHV